MFHNKTMTKIYRSSHNKQRHNKLRIRNPIEENFSFDKLDLSNVKVASIADSMSIWEQTENRVSILGRKLREGDATDDWMIRYCGQIVRRGVAKEDLYQSVINYHDKFFDSGSFSQEDTERWLRTKIDSAYELDRRN